MLIYNYQKEFLGISNEDLSILGFSNLAELRMEAYDFADLFVKTPGFVHNFKHVHWIDFVTCAESNDDSKVIIRAHDKNFKCILDIQTIYLVNEPTQKAYIINLVNLRELSGSENTQVSLEATHREVPNASSATQDAFDIPSFNEDELNKEVVTPKEAPQTKQEIFKPESVPTIPKVEASTAIVADDAPLDLGDFDDSDTDFSELNDIEFDNIEIEETPIQTPEQVAPVAVTPKVVPAAVTSKAPKKIYAQNLEVGDNYLYNPQVASDELGLPVDLIEEFIEDFIAQAIEFKDDLYKSLDEDNIDNVKVLSHKLKGVAANLRIEDAFEVLSTINTSEDRDIIMRNMNTLYMVINKLAGKEPEEETTEEIGAEDDDFILDLKGDETVLDLDEPFELQADLDVDEPFELQADLDVDEPFELQADLDIDEPLELQADLDVDEPFELQADLDIDEPLELQADLDINSNTTVINYNKNAIASEIGIDQVSFDELFHDYIDEAQKMCTDIKNAIVNSDTKLWQHEAVIFKSMSDNMRVDDFKIDLENIIKSTDINEAQSAIDRIEAKVQQLSQMEV